MSSEVEPEWLCSVQVPRQGGHKGVADEVKTLVEPSLERLRAAGTGAQGPGWDGASLEASTHTCSGDSPGCLLCLRKTDVSQGNGG